MWLRWVGTWARDTVRWHWSADTLFWQLSIDRNIDVYYQVKRWLQAPTLAREFDLSHWLPCVTKCCMIQSVLCSSIKVYFFTCSYFRILYSVLHLKDSSTSIRVKIRWSTLNPHTWSVPRLWTTIHSSKTLVQSSVFRPRDEFSRHNDAIITNTL